MNTHARIIVSVHFTPVHLLNTSYQHVKFEINTFENNREICWTRNHETTPTQGVLSLLFVCTTLDCAWRQAVNMYMSRSTRKPTLWTLHNVSTYICSILYELDNFNIVSLNTNEHWNALSWAYHTNKVFWNFFIVYLYTKCIKT